MGVLINGIWRDEELPQEIGRVGDFRRADSSFRDRGLQHEAFHHLLINFNVDEGRTGARKPIWS